MGRFGGARHARRIITFDHFTLRDKEGGGEEHHTSTHRGTSRLYIYIHYTYNSIIFERSCVCVCVACCSFLARVGYTKHSTSTTASYGVRKNSCSLLLLIFFLFSFFTGNDWNFVRFGTLMFCGYFSR